MGKILGWLIHYGRLHGCVKCYKMMLTIYQTHLQMFLSVIVAIACFQSYIPQLVGICQKYTGLFEVYTVRERGG